MTWVEKFLFEKFGSMPLWVRVLSYLVILLLFIYLMLLPRFINGDLVFRTDSGGTIPYRAANLRTHVDGRVLKFKTNEDGYWSIPIVSRLPHSIRVEAYLDDERAWYGLEIKPSEIWFGDMVRLEVVSNPAGLKLLKWSKANSSVFSPPVAAAADFEIDPQIQASFERNAEQRVFATIEEVTGKTERVRTRNYRLTGEGAPNTKQKIEIILRLEKLFSLKIPDEVWKDFGTAGELIDYITNYLVLRYKVRGD